MSLSDLCNNLPNEIIRKILSLLDIDTRRALGVYVKLKIPSKIEQNLNFVFSRYKIQLLFNPHYPVTNIAILDLNSLYIIKHEWYSLEKKKRRIEPNYTVIYHDYIFGREHLWWI